MHICLLGGGGRGKQTWCVSVGRGCLQNRDGVMGPESRELSVSVACVQRQREADYRAGSRGHGCGCKELGTHLTVKVGVTVTLVTRLGSGLALQANMLERKHKKHWLKLFSPSFLFLHWSTGQMGPCHHK